MSEYADIVVKNLSLAWFRNYVDSYIVSLFFTRSDLSITPNCKIDLGEDGSEEYTQYVYRTTVKKAKERLDAQGYSLNKLEKLFNEKILYAIDYTRFLLHLGIEFEEHENKVRERSNNKYLSQSGKMQCIELSPMNWITAILSSMIPISRLD